MKLLRLNVRGSIGLKKGLNLDSVDLDFSSLNGLVAITGANGVGKSSLLEFLHPYACLASRKGTLSKHFFLRDSYKDLEFEMNGAHYRSLIKIDSESGRTEGYLWKNHDTKSLVDGKISNYTKYIKELIGSSELFFNSTFYSQNAKQLNELTPGKLKELFSEFLRLYKLIEYEDTAKQCVNLFSDKKSSLRADLAQIKEEIAAYNDPASALAEAEKKKIFISKDISRTRQVLEVLEEEMSTAQAACQKNELLKVEKDNVEKDISRLTSGIEKDRQQETKELAALRSRYHEVALELTAIDKLLANESEIRNAVEKVASASAVLNTYTTSLNSELEPAHSSAMRALSEKEADLNTALSDYKSLKSNNDNEGKLCQQEHNTAKLAVADLDKRDPDCESTTCSFIIRALDSQKNIGQLEKRIAESASSGRVIEKEFAAKQIDLKAEIRTLAVSEININAEREALVKKIAQKKLMLEPIKILADEFPKIANAETRKTKAENLKLEIGEEGRKVKENWLNRIVEQKTQRTKAEAFLLDLHVDTDMNDSLTPIAEKLKVTKALIEEATETLSEASTSISLCKKDVLAQKQLTEDATAKEVAISTATAELFEWQYLKGACGKDGLRALEIASVAPVITAHANDLLIATFGPAFTIRFKTQDDEGREVLEIIVIREDGSEVALDFLSGGERVWLLKALRLSMTLISKEKSGVEFLSGFADELDGALDIDHAITFVQMYRSFMSAGGFESFYFISHKPECQALADHRLQFGNGRVMIK